MNYFDCQIKHYSAGEGTKADHSPIIIIEAKDLIRHDKSDLIMCDCIRVKIVGMNQFCVSVYHDYCKALVIAIRKPLIDMLL